MLEYWLVLAYGVFYLAPVFVVNYLQHNYIARELQNPPVLMNAKDYQQAGEYALAKLRFQNIEHLWGFGLFAFWVFWGLEWINDVIASLHIPGGRNLNCVAVILLFVFVGQIATLPFRYYQEMVLDRRFGFSKQTFGNFISDMLKSAFVLFLLGSIIFYLLVSVIVRFEMWWCLGALVAWLFVFLANFIYPTLIAPIFNKFTPLKDPVLKERIEELLHKVGFRSSGIFVMDASKRDGRLNAYFGGFGRSKRVVLFDTLLDKISSDGLLAILGHELGHYYYRDTLKSLGIMAVFIFAIFFLVGHFPVELFEELGLHRHSANILVVMMLVAPIVFFWFLPIAGFFSRKAEYRADAFGSSLASKRALGEALVRIVNENKSFPSSHRAYIFFYYTHPPLLERLKALDYAI
ncbi:peptidase M48 [Helicobacter enhydrae]|uniref:Peptidase M48 n=1 Tax=Helicobacter enhydrae TaxID=222136 RepID=A0A1B1U504_9HELI|nr:M48 family metallopeptidase [Helicobacter enhydrae]ANV97836.1 peptidase M48 [Helicobacter enhydrae]